MPEHLKSTFNGVLGSSKMRYVNLLLYFKIKKIIKEHHITDLIIVHPYYGWLAWLLKKTTGVKLSMLSHNIEAIRFKSMAKPWWRILWLYEKQTHKILDNNFFVTKEDLDFAIENYDLSPAKCFVITYGIEWQKCPNDLEKKEAAQQLRQLHKIKSTEKIVLFNGSLDYTPNIEAVNYILEEINPILLAEKNFAYKIIICGRGLPPVYQDLKNYTDKNIIYAGFVEDINIYFKGADIFINPVITGGGIKTKLVEALGNNVTAVSTTSGAFGIPIEMLSDKLIITKDFNWQSFTDAILHANENAVIDPAFFNHFYWGNIAKKAAAILTANSTNN